MVTNMMRCRPEGGGKAVVPLLLLLTVFLAGSLEFTEAALQCYHCPTVLPDQSCTRTYNCSDHEVCLQRYVSSGDKTYYELGCFARQLCGLLAHLFHSKSSCCDHDLCNGDPFHTNPVTTTQDVKTSSSPRTTKSTTRQHTTKHYTTTRPTTTKHTTTRPTTTKHTTTQPTTTKHTTTRPTTTKHIPTQPTTTKHITTRPTTTKHITTRPTTTRYTTQPTTTKYTTQPTTTKYTTHPTTTNYMYTTTLPTITKHTTTQPTTTTQHTTTGSTTVITRTAAIDVTCFVCVGPVDLCELSNAPVTCSPPNNYCINTVTNMRDGARQVDKRCGSETECRNDWWKLTSDKTQCTSFDENYLYTRAFSCTFCCTSSFCNEKLHPDSSTLYRP